MGLIIYLAIMIMIILTFLRVGQMRDMMEKQMEYNEELVEEIKELKEELKKRPEK